MSNMRGWLVRWLLAAGVWLMIVSEASCQEIAPVRGNARIKQLEREVQHLSGKEKVDMLNDLAFEWYSFDTKQAAEKAIEALQISKEIKYEKGRGQALVYIGMFERLSGDQQKARTYLKEGVHYTRKSKDVPSEGYALIQLANFYSTIGQLDSANLAYADGFKVLKDSLHPFQLSSLFKNWAKLYGQRNDRVNQRKLLMRSLRIREIMKDPLLLSDIYLNLANYYTQTQNYQEAWRYIKKSEEQQPLLGGDLESSYDLKYHKAMLHFKQLNYMEALNLYNEVKIFYKENFPRQDYVTLIIDVAYILSDLGNYELSLSNSYEALKIAEENGFQLERTKLLWQIGWVYVNLKQLPLAKEFAHKALTEARLHGFRVEESYAYNLLGVIYDYDSKYDSSLYYFDKALALREELNDVTRVASTLNNIGAVLEKQGKFQEALAIQYRSLRLEESGTNYIGVAWTNFSIGQLYFKMKKHQNALQYLDKSEAFAKKNAVKQMLHDVYQVKAKLYEEAGNLALSVRYYKEYDVLRDSLMSTNLTNRIAGLQSEYTLLQKNQEIEILSRDKKLREAQLNVEQGRVRQQRIVIISGSVIFLLLVIASYSFYRNLQKVKELNRTIQENSEEIQAQSEELQLSNQTIARINEGLEQMVETRTKELKQAYKELDTFFYRSSHDFRRPLTTFMGLAEVAKITVKDDVALGLFEKVNETARSLDKMLIKLQSISDVGSLQLIYKEIFMEEVFTTVEDAYREELKAKEIRVVTEVKSTTSFFSYTALIKVIVENLVENAIMFSDSHQTIVLSVQTDNNGLTITVTDNGWGIEEQYQEQVFDMYFRAHERSKGNGLGLYIVKKVVEKLNGTIELSSEQGKGTRVSVSLPHKITHPVMSV